jgi:probable HAF family extracellular repeat protein
MLLDLLSLLFRTPGSSARSRRFSIAWVVLGVMVPAAAGQAVPRYKIVTLEPLPGGVDSYATAINEFGVVVGHSTLNRSGHVGRSRPVMWDSSGEPTELWSDQTFGGIPADINNQGQVVGRYGSGSGIPLPGPGIPPGGAFLWDPLTRDFMDLGDLGGRNAQATGINDAGQVTGSSENFEGQPRAFIWDPTNDMRPIGTLGGIWSFGLDINANGQVAGYSWRADESEHAYLWDPMAGMRDLGNANRLGTRAYSLNDKAEVVGNGTISDDQGGAMLWADGQTTGIFSASVQFALATGVNDGGQVVGSAIGDDHVFAVIWDEFSGAQSLSTLIPSGTGWTLDVATAINDRGQIAGYGRLDDQIRGFLLSPIPEPTSRELAPAFFGGVILLSRAIRSGPRRACGAPTSLTV